MKHLVPVDFRTLSDEVAGGDQWLVEPLIPAKRSTSIVAEAGLGKSLLMLDIATAIATGRGIFNRVDSPPTSVVYVDMEMTPDDLASRLESLGVDYSRSKKLRKNLHYYQLQDFKPFDTRTGGRQLLEVVQTHEPELVVIDTVAGVVQGEENSADTYRNFAQHTGKKLKANGVTVVRLDHTGKNSAKGARGSSAKRDDVDVAWQMSARPNSPGSFVLACAKRRIGNVPNRVDIVRSSDEPLRHVLKVTELSSRVKELISILDGLGLPEATGRDRARAALVQADVQCSNDDLSAALRERKRRGGQPDRSSWHTDRTGGADR